MSEDATQQAPTPGEATQEGSDAAPGAAENPDTPKNAATEYVVLHLELSDEDGNLWREVLTTTSRSQRGAKDAAAIKLAAGGASVGPLIAVPSRSWDPETPKAIDMDPKVRW